MTFKKVLSALMAGAMVLSLGMTAFASATPPPVDLETTDPYELVIEGETAVPTVKIVVPEFGGVIANPYKLTVDATKLGGTATESDQIVSPVQYVKNLTKADINVKATVYAYTDGEAFFGSAKKDDMDKWINASFEMGLCDGSTAPASYAEKIAALEIKEEGQTTGALKMVQSADGSAVATNGAVGFHFTGTMNGTPAAPWTEGDIFGASIVFEFEPAANT